MQYKIHHDYSNDNIDVFYNDKLYMKVERHFNFWNKMTSVFTIDDKIILKSTYDVVWFQQKISITYQNLDSILSLVKNKGRYYLKVDNLSIILKYHYFKNPIRTLVDNNIIIGRIETELFSIIGPQIYFVSLDCKKEHELYCLIRFCLELKSAGD